MLIIKNHGITIQQLHHAIPPQHFFLFPRKMNMFKHQYKVVIFYYYHLFLFLISCGKHAITQANIWPGNKRSPDIQ